MVLCTSTLVKKVDRSHVKYSYIHTPKNPNEKQQIMERSNFWEKLDISVN